MKHKPKISQSFTVDPDNLLVVQEFCKKANLPVSFLVDSFVQGLAIAIKAKGLHKKEVVTKIDAAKVLAYGMVNEV